MLINISSQPSYRASITNLNQIDLKNFQKFDALGQSSQVMILTRPPVNNFELQSHQMLEELPYQRLMRFNCCKTRKSFRIPRPKTGEPMMVTNAATKQRIPQLQGLIERPMSTSKFSARLLMSPRMASPSRSQIGNRQIKGVTPARIIDDKPKMKIPMLLRINRGFKMSKLLSPQPKLQVSFFGSGKSMNKILQIQS